MRPARFVTLCFLYSGVVLLAQYVAIYRFQVTIGAFAQLGVGLSVLAVGLVRLRYPEEERENPGKWGLFTYGMAGLALFLTGIFFVQLVFL